MSKSKEIPEYYVLSGQWHYPEGRGADPVFRVRYVLAGRVRTCYARGQFSHEIKTAIISQPR